MPFKIRSSKFRHVYGSAHKEDYCYKNIKITKNASHDSSFCAVNAKFVAVVTEECGGGAFLVVPIRHTGRVDMYAPKVSGHRGPVLDLKWNPFNDNEIASCSEDATIKVWQIGDDEHGLAENLTDWLVDLHGHQRKVGQIEWHPTAEHIMLSSGADCQVMLWNLEKAEPIRIILCHSDLVQSLSWSRDGRFLATTCKDRRLRLIDPRTGAVLAEGDGHQGAKISKVIMLECGKRLLTTGFSRLSERQIALWSITDLSKPLHMETVDCASGLLIPYYDADTRIVYVAGKGDGNIRYYELTECEPYMHYLSEYKSSSPQRGLGFMPKRGLDVTKNEIFRFYKLHATGGLCEPISMIVPRKSEMFQEDIYPDALSGIPSLSCDEWLMGENREPILVSMKDGALSFMPKIVTYKQLGMDASRARYRNAANINNNNNNNNNNSNNINTSISFSVIKSNNNNNNNNNLTNSRGPLKASYSTLPNAKRISHTSNTSTSTTNTSNETTNRESYTPSPPSSASPTSHHHHHHHHHQPSSQLLISKKYLADNDDCQLITCDTTMSSSPHNDSLPLDLQQQQQQHHLLMMATCDGNDSTHQRGNILALQRLSSSGESLNQHQSEQLYNNNNTNNEDEQMNVGENAGGQLETTYATSVSRNTVLLKKTESLKIDRSFSTIRNRFNRMNSVNLSSLRRNSMVAAAATLPHSQSTQYESSATQHQQHQHLQSSSLDAAATAYDSDSLPPPPPRVVQSSLEFAGSGGVRPRAPIARAPNSNNYNKNNSNNNSNSKDFECVTTTSRRLLADETNNSSNGPSGNSAMLIGQGTCIKKRVWTPVVPGSGNAALLSDANAKSADKGVIHTNFAELQRSYFRLLDEKNAVREQLTAEEARSRQLESELVSRDKRIQSLESMINRLMDETPQRGERLRLHSQMDSEASKSDSSI